MSIHLWRLVANLVCRTTKLDSLALFIQQT